MSEETKKAKVIAIVNHKGGCGKTTSTVNLASEFARQGNSVLVVDLDPQANATLHIGNTHPSKVPVSSAELLTGDDSMLPLAVQEETTIEGVSLISGSLALGKAEDELKDLSPRPNEELRSKLQPAIAVFDVILIDCPPSLKLLASNALAAATHVIVPIEAGDQYGLYGAEDLLKKVTQIRRINPDLEMLGALLIKYDDRQTICKLLAGQAEKTFGKLLPEKISQGTAVQKAAVLKTSTHGVDRSSKPARQFRQLAAALAKQLQLKVSDDVLAEEAAA
ncbi:ParA family protein [Cupriavidus oxalaticus]|uniref:ParA family protein n=1 Tax=Cupriavidus oxalaticus TaxID=96344 RepID=A0A4P7LR43_9BURK|nr:ParA family protein [Cupriavidus oxalaticus]QBY56123.1 ParA family protein [Cupriavidus oxalaticus]